jgi:predicted glycoside hydrolase/deacetylase ChbG (UPF0249 family)
VYESIFAQYTIQSRITDAYKILHSLAQQMETYLKELDTQLFFFANHQLANVVFDWLCLAINSIFFKQQQQQLRRSQRSQQQQQQQLRRFPRSPKAWLQLARSSR